MRIGVLALQGAFIEHVQALCQLGVEAVELRQLPDLEQPLDGIVLRVAKVRCRESCCMSLVCLHRCRKK